MLRELVNRFKHLRPLKTDMIRLLIVNVIILREGNYTISRLIMIGSRSDDEDDEIMKDYVKVDNHKKYEHDENVVAVVEVAYDEKHG
ncbi:hypothetical protein GJ496_004451 [Pomphorhynchus laevis]|nr:hypothetical protein GJ496_004451 [Pomphorhynchus laevis]